jgi:hypothetical protein
MRELILEKSGSSGIAAVFHEDGGEGYFALYKLADEEILQQVQLYSRPTLPEVQEDDVDIFWSHGEGKAGIAVWGRMRATLDLEGKDEQVCLLETPDSPAIQGKNAVSVFPQYLDRKTFLEARKLYWKTALLQARPDLVLPNQPTSLLETRFLVVEMDSRGTRAAVFEDEGETGYLYVYSVGTGTVQSHVHIYDQSGALQITKESVDVLWSSDESKCAVKIWGQMRGVIDLRAKKEGRAWLENRDTPGISDKEWLKGFELI